MLVYQRVTIENLGPSKKMRNHARQFDLRCELAHFVSRLTILSW